MILEERTSFKPETAQAFVEALGGLDRASLAMLKRNAGRTIAESRGAMGVFYRALPPSLRGARSEEICFLVATLYPMNPRSHDGNLGSTMRAVKAARGKTSQNDSMDKRMNALLDSDFESGAPASAGEMAYRLRHAVRLAAAAEVGIDWPLLVKDLYFWAHPKREARKRWARSYYGQAGKETDSVAHK